MCVAGWVAACAGPAASALNSAIRTAIKDLFMRGPSAAPAESLRPIFASVPALTKLRRELEIFAFVWTNGREPAQH
jgi:hypothetical protein